VAADYVHWKDFGHNICRTWDEVWLVWRMVYLDRDELKEALWRERANNSRWIMSRRTAGAQA
jgi:hypothetical protein